MKMILSACARLTAWVDYVGRSKVKQMTLLVKEQQ